jgi:SynChlorMet cassette radical SAM/SPASM protein ScmF
VGLPAGVPPLTSLYLYIAGACNLACLHCWITPTFVRSNNGGQYVDLGYVEQAIREAKPLGLGAVKLTGGEPMLHPQFRELVSLLDNAGLNITVETNGTLIDDSLAHFLRQKEYFSFISVSLDGVDAETHDALRRVPGSFEQAVAGIRALAEVGFRPQVICTLHRGNAGQLADVVALARELGCGSVKFNHVQGVGRGDSFRDANGLTVEEVLGLYRRVEDELVPQADIPIYFDVPFAFFPIRRMLDNRVGHCGILNILGMLSGGELALCGIGTTVPDLIYGHMARDSLRDVWLHAPGLLRLREQIPARLEGVCADCIHREFCLGSCVANNFHEAGRLNVPYWFCDQAEALGLFPESRRRGGVSSQ